MAVRKGNGFRIQRHLLMLKIIRVRQMALWRGLTFCLDMLKYHRPNLFILPSQKVETMNIGTGYQRL
jgi:hypothetical protein